MGRTRSRGIGPGIPCRIATLLLLGTLAACGGGGGNGGSSGEEAGAGDEPRRLVFLALQPGDVFHSLWAAPDDASGLDRLDDPAIIVGPGSFAVSPDNQRVAYTHESAGGIPGLYVVDSAGVDRIEVSGNTAASATIFRIEWSPDSRHIAFVSDQATAGSMNPVKAVYVVDADGGNLREISQAVADLVDDPRWSPNGRYVAMEVSTAGGGDFDLAVYDIEADTLVAAINGSAVGNASTKAFEAVAWSPDNARIAYTIDRDTDDRIELYISTIDGMTTVTPHPILEGSVRAFAWRPGDGGRIAYIAELERGNLGNLMSELFTAAADGSGEQKEHPDLVFGNLDVKGFRYSPDGDHIAFSRDPALAGVTDLYVNTRPGDQRVARFNEAALGQFGWSLDSQRLIYQAGSSGPCPGRTCESLYSVSRTGFNDHRAGFANPSPLNGPLTSAVPVVGLYESSPIEPLLAYRADLGSDGFVELFVNASTGGNEEQLSPDPEPGTLWQEITWLRYAPASPTLAYLLEVNRGTVTRELYAGTPGDGPAVKLSGDLGVAAAQSVHEPSY